MTIDVGMTMPTMLVHDRRDVHEWCRAVDEGPWSALSVPERITYTSHSLTVELAAAGAITERVRLWTTIIILPAHPAVQVAKDMASVDRLCDGRLTVGIGVGGREHDYRAVEASFDRRWQRMDEQVDTMHSVWRGEPPFEGADPVGPPPAQPGGPPLVAGAMGPKALARSARWAVGIDHGATILGLRRAGSPTTTFLDFTTDELAGVVGRAREAWSAAGRTDRPHVTASLFFALGPDAERKLGSYTYDYLKLIDDGYARSAAEAAVCFDERSLRETVSAMDDAGCDQVLLTSAGTSVDDVHRAADVLFG